ncbi:acyltransferase family protein [Brucella thiophenivorans]|uniref:Acyltransferase family protein n=1 Tax=Brucella thiophenivorans TaxID=571255 RepID=A0A256FC28_9HYPH|nr:acyltransferase [Brucella thiophenivorans]OYR12226.1 acyltransferase family protein [Brucella thiophenivorans]
MAPKPKLMALESLRGFAALAVVLHHFDYGSILTENSFTRHSYLMVDFFFVLSGYVIALNYANRLSSAGDVRRFQTRRFWRLYPLHLFTLLLFIGIECMKFVFEKNTSIVANTAAFSTNDGYALLANLLLLQGVTLRETTFNAPSWSISVEFWTYLLFALVVVRFGFRTVWCVAIIITAGFALIVLEKGHLETEPIVAIIRCIYAFFLGAWASNCSVRLSQSINTSITATALILIVVGVSVFGGSRVEILFPVIFAGTIVAIANLNEHERLRRSLEWKGFVWLGTISYSVYLTHAIVGWVVTQILRFGLKMPTKVHADGTITLALENGIGTSITVLAVILVLAFSALTYRFIETPFRNGWPFGRLLSSTAKNKT